MIFDEGKQFTKVQYEKFGFDFEMEVLKVMIFC